MIKVGDSVTRNNELLGNIKPFKVLSVYEHKNTKWVTLSNDQVSPFPITDKLSNLTKHEPLTVVYGASVNMSGEITQPLFENVVLDSVSVFIDFTKWDCNISDQKGILHNVVPNNIYIEYKGELPEGCVLIKYESGWGDKHSEAFSPNNKITIVRV